MMHAEYIWAGIATVILVVIVSASRTVRLILLDILRHPLKRSILEIPDYQPGPRAELHI